MRNAKPASHSISHSIQGIPMSNILMFMSSKCLQSVVVIHFCHIMTEFSHRNLINGKLQV